MLNSNRKQSTRSIILGVLIVGASIAGAVSFTGSTAAQTSTASAEFTTSPHKAMIDTANVTSDTTVKVITDGSPAGNNTVIAKQTVPGSMEEVHFRNAGAYESFTLVLEGANDSEVSFQKGGVFDAYTGNNDLAYFVGDTGGDAGFTYDLDEQVSSMTTPKIKQLDKTALPGTTTADTSGLDSDATEVEIYESAQNVNASSANHYAVLDNYLQDTKTQARIIGKNAYIKALNNGESEAASISAAKQAVNDYYSTKERNVVSVWNQHVLAVENHRAAAEADPNIPMGTDGFIDARTINVGQYPDARVEPSGSSTYTLSNGETVDTHTITVNVVNTADTSYNMDHTANVDSGTLVDRMYSTSQDSTDRQLDITGILAGSPSSVDAPQINYLRFDEYSTRLNEINNQNQKVQNDMETLANNTYSEYQSGDINISDLADPYTLSQSSQSEDFEGWAAGQLSLLGVNSPQNLDQTGSFNVTTETGDRYRGVLYSQDNPASGEFAVGSTYNPNDIGGVQYIATSDGLTSLNENFTVKAIEDTDGNQLQNTTMEKKQYTTTNVTELQQLYDDLAQERAEIEARKAALQSSGGGGLLGGGQSSTYLIVGGAALLLLAGREANQ